MTPLHHKILIGVIASLASAGILAISGILVTTLQTSARIEAKMEDISTDFDSFVNLRYQADMDGVSQEFTRVNDRIDKAIQ